MPAGETQAGEMPAGETPAAVTPAGETPAGETPAGEAPTGEAATGETPAGEAPTGEAATGETPAGEAPAGEDKLSDAQAQALVKQKCTMCHPIARVDRKTADASGWEAVVAKMVKNGLQISASERSAIIAYLASRRAGNSGK